MKYKISLIFILIGFQIYSQEIIENKLTDKHRKIDCTKISLILPDDFVASSNFLGFNHLNSSARVSLNFSNISILKTILNFSKDKFETNDFKILKYQKKQFNSYPAIFISGEFQYGNQFYQRHIFVFGNKNETYTLISSFSDETIGLDSILENAVLSVYYDKKQKVNSFSCVDFKVDVSKEIFTSFDTQTKNVRIHKIDEDYSNFFLRITKGEYEKEVFGSKEEFVKEYFNLFQKDILKITSKKKIEINGLSGYELIADTKKGKAYYIHLYKGDFYYRVHGYTVKDIDLEAFKSISKSFSLKVKN